MSAIEIKTGEKVVSRIYSAQKVEGATEYLEKEPAVFLVYDAALRRYADRLSKALGDRLKAAIAVETGEDTKNMDTVLSICRCLLEAGADRKSILVNLGGGITTDMGGFAATIFKRGIRFANIPTTLLSQVDAAIGGKTGVNFMDYKNMLGTIIQPEFIYECPEVLKTLPYRDFASGVAEILKTFIIDNSSLCYEKAVQLFSSVNSSEDRKAAIAASESQLLEIISAAAAVKAGVVSRDQYERGERANLNLGHTFAHAVESEALAKGDDITHGEAVAIGMVQAALLSERLGIAEEGLAVKIASDLASCGLPTVLPYPMEKLSQSMSKDKKAEGKSVRFILVESVGKVIQKEMIPQEVAQKLD